MTTDKPFIEFRNMSVRFGRQQVLRGINLAIEQGQTVAVIGESGCGKTVFLKTLIGLVKPTRGEVLFDGQNLQNLGDKELVQQRIRFGYLFQNAALFDSMTIGQNVAFPLRQHRQVTDQQVQEVVLARLAEVGLPDSVVVKKPAELSGGMRKRVGIARAIALRPRYILYDEPTTGLDPVTSAVIDGLMVRARQELGVTGLVVTHDMRSAYTVGDRIAMLYQGRVRQVGTVAEFKATSDPLVRQFIEGRPSPGPG